MESKKAVKDAVAGFAARLASANPADPWILEQVANDIDTSAAVLEDISSTKPFPQTHAALIIASNAIRRLLLSRVRNRASVVKTIADLLEITAEHISVDDNRRAASPSRHNGFTDTCHPAGDVEHAQQHSETHSTESQPASVMPS